MGNCRLQSRVQHKNEEKEKEWWRVESVVIQDLDRMNYKKILCLFPLLILINQAPAATLIGRVVGVADGDTITVLDAASHQHKIRLSGIDAPEKKQPFGQSAKVSLSGLVFSKMVQVETHKIDLYGRSVGRVFVGGRDANLEQLRRGLAWHYKMYEREQPAAERAAYGRAEEEARLSKVGLWSDAHPVAPWEFRHASKKKH